MRFAAGLVLLLALAIGVWVFRPWQASAPDVIFSTLKGERISLRQLKGHPVLVTFWATDCRPCLEEIPELIRLHEDYAGKGLRVFAVSMAYDVPSRVVALAAAKRIPYTLSLDLDGAQARAFSQVSVIPNSFLISPKGEISLQKVGAVDFPSLRKRIETLLEEV